MERGGECCFCLSYGGERMRHLIAVFGAGQKSASRKSNTRGTCSHVLVGGFFLDGVAVIDSLRLLLIKPVSILLCLLSIVGCLGVPSLLGLQCLREFAY